MRWHLKLLSRLTLKDGMALTLLAALKRSPPGKIMDDQMSYKEFLDHNVPWKMDERDRCFDSQLAFQPTDVTGEELRKGNRSGLAC
ncbi:UNVERIFIED_CONTAM: hypothetical protein K2H54_001670 [Gekko kuhli]